MSGIKIPADVFPFTQILGSLIIMIVSFRLQTFVKYPSVCEGAFRHPLWLDHTDTGICTCLHLHEDYTYINHFRLDLAPFYCRYSHSTHFSCASIGLYSGGGCLHTYPHVTLWKQCHSYIIFAVRVWWNWHLYCEHVTSLCRLVTSGCWISWRQCS